MKVLLITGGNSSEREISLKSANNVEQSLVENGHEVKLYDLRNGYESIIKLSEQYDILFPVLHGEEGEGGKLHKFLSKINKPIVGTRNYKGLQNGWYKIPFKKYCDENNISTPKWRIIKNKQEILKFGIPCVLKASNGGSSREVSVIKTEQDLQSKEVKRIINLKTPLFVEEYLEAVEITVGILNNKPLPIIELIPPKGEYFSYKNKYSGKTQEIPFAPSLERDFQKKVQKLTLKIHRDFNLGSYSRTDFIFSNRKAFALDINTIPGLTSESLMPKAANAAGMNFGEFLEILLKNAE